MGLAEADFEEDLEEDQKGLEFSDSDWDNANQSMMSIQLAVTFSFLGYGFTISDVQIYI